MKELLVQLPAARPEQEQDEEERERLAGQATF